MSLKFVILKHLEVISHKKNICKNLTMWILLVVIFKDTHTFCKICENYQKLGFISKHHMMSLNPILVIEIFDCWGIDFMGPFPLSFIFLYILVVINYVSKWIDAIPSQNNDHKTMIFERKYFESIWNPSSHDKWSWNTFLQQVIWIFNKEIWITHKVVTPYYSQISGQVELANKKIKQILKKTVNHNWKDYSLRFNDALWAY